MIERQDVFDRSSGRIKFENDCPHQSDKLSRETANSLEKLRFPSTVLTARHERLQRNIFLF